MTLMIGPETVAVVTGGASGIGRALAAALVARGARVAIADVSLEQAASTADALGGVTRAYGCDVTSREQVETLAAAVERDLGPVSLVFANAGVAVGGKLADTNADEFQWLMDVNVGGTFTTVQVFLPHLLRGAQAGRPTRLVLTGSENSLGVPGGSPSSAYTATKHAVMGMADALRRDLDGSGVGVSIFCPGLVATRIWDARRHRQDRYGGRADMPSEYAERAASAMAAHGQAPALTADIALKGVARGDFLIITDPRIRALATRRTQQVHQALDHIDQQLANKEAPR